MRKLLGEVVLVAALASAACYTMVPMSFEDVRAERPGMVFVTRGDASVLLLTGPQIFGDTMVGYAGAEYYELDREEVYRVEMKRSAKGKTMGLIAASIAGAAAVGVLISGAGSDSPLHDCHDTPDIPPCQGQDGGMAP